jgi:hypothetical protein
MNNIRVFLALLIFGIFLGACEQSESSGSEAEGVINKGIVSEDNSSMEKTLLKKLELNNQNQLTEVKLTYAPGLTLSIGEEEQVISEDIFADTEWSDPPKIDVQAIDQGDRTNTILIVSVEKPDQAFGTALRLWAFEYYDNGWFRQIWSLEDEAAQVSYSVTYTGDYQIQLDEPRYTQILDIDQQTYQQLEVSGKRLESLKLSPPIDFLLDDVFWGEQEDIIVRRKVIGEKPEWLPFDYVMTIYFARRGHIDAMERYTSSEEKLYSRNDLIPIFILEKETYYNGMPLIKIETNSPIDRDSLTKAISSSLVSSDPNRLNFDYDLNWIGDKKVEIRFNDVAEGEVVYFGLKNVSNWLGIPIRPSYPLLQPNVVFSKAQYQEPFIAIQNVYTGKQTRLDAPLAEQIYLVETGQKWKSIFAMAENEHQLMDPQNGSVKNIPIPSNEEDELSMYSKFYPDRFFETYNYVFKSLTKLYRYDWHGNRSRNFETNRGKPGREHSNDSLT